MVIRSLECRVHTHFTPSNSALDHEAGVNTDELQTELWDVLRATGYFSGVRSKIIVDVGTNGHVLLRGTVPSYYHKQLAQVAVMSVAGVLSLQNDLVVKSTEKRHT